MSRWMKKGFWKLINGELWYYKGYRASYSAASYIVYNFRWDGSNLKGIKEYNNDKSVYEIFVRPRQE